MECLVYVVEIENTGDFVEGGSYEVGDALVFRFARAWAGWFVVLVFDEGVVKVGGLDASFEG